MKKLLFLLTILPLLLLADNVTQIKYELLDYSMEVGDYVNVPGTDPVCKAYVDALNNYPPIVDFFVAPQQPNSSEFGYPKWEQLDLVEYEGLFLKIEDYSGVANKTYINISKIKQLQSFTKNKIPDLKKNRQLYYTIADIDNDGKQESIVKKDNGRYASQFYLNEYSTRLTVFKLAKPKKLSVINNQLSRVFQKETFIYDLLFYKGKTYIKRISGVETLQNGYPTDIMLQSFNQDKELVNLCYIVKNY